MSIITDTYYENKSVKKHIYMYYKNVYMSVIEIYKYEKIIANHKTQKKIMGRLWEIMGDCENIWKNITKNVTIQIIVCK